ncbi:sensor histidine kinase [Nannocystis radixulma]|uniref:histidine kinase n=1 Tax=Nannocystis radixulma TaxID=2995305 RepID=A0ABT5BFL9_9BACT|nr:HAMP domain-containing sensor histidine kinase [Nannocystis radixulma]MDC0672945.1 HAMP domain-containing sensor histidine kinase [Nannocystis radixulma]
MGSTKKQPHPERDKTDQSLALERQKSDSELSKQRERLEEGADEVVRLARERADLVLDQSRKRADDLLEPGDDTTEVQRRALQERVDADEALREERLAADEQLLIEREQRSRGLQELLNSEREATDRDLRAERRYSDQTLASREDFLGVVSHELRGTLVAIAMHAAMLVRQSTADESGRRVIVHADKIQRSLGRMQRLIDDLVDLASIEAGRLKITTQRDDLARLAREAVEIFQSVAAARGVQLVLEAPQHSVPARFDHQRILQVLTNLLANAVKFTPEGGKIVIHVEPKGEDVRLSVSDTGSGIPEDKLNVIFERFGQVAADDPRGAGLGLFIAKSIIDAHGGKIGADSRSGEGSVFFFTLPAAPGDA